MVDFFGTSRLTQSKDITPGLAPKQDGLTK